ncbi:MAG: glycosyltransferase involved in cell wall biosynthesis [bacterium]|jgi:glycosyltransferase involved in cell wall biosynthesis
MSLSTATVTVIIPTHNRIDSLSIAINSVLDQQYPIDELIVVDDGSTDGTSDWCKQTHPEVILITQENHGVSHARNRAVEIAQGEWIALLDSDDRWYPEKLSIQMDAISQNPELRFCHCDEHWIRNGKRVNPKHKHRKYGGDVFKHCLPLCAVSPSASLLHRSLFSDVGLFDESLPACEDYDLWLRICCREEVLFVDQALLEKTGGHEDQLSQRYPVMDQYRLKALAKILRAGILSAEQQQQASTTFHEKLKIFCLGARKRGRQQSIQSMLSEYQDLIDPSVSLYIKEPLNHAHSGIPPAKRP